MKAKTKILAVAAIFFGLSSSNGWSVTRQECERVSGTWNLSYGYFDGSYDCCFISIDPDRPSLTCYMFSREGDYLREETWRGIRVPLPICEVKLMPDRFSS